MGPGTGEDDETPVPSKSAEVGCGASKDPRTSYAVAPGDRVLYRAKHRVDVKSGGEM